MRETISLDGDWLFHEGDIQEIEAHDKTNTYFQAKTESKRTGAASINWLDNSNAPVLSGTMAMMSWENVTLPHDYLIKQTPDESNNFTWGGFKYHNAWYRRHFTLSGKERGRRIRIYFEGITGHSTIYINGCIAGRNYCGYNSFECDISNLVRFDEENVLAVYVNITEEHEGWWYEGAGIYRHVWMIITDPVFIDTYGVYVHPRKKESVPHEMHWDIPVETEIRNDSETQNCFSVAVSIIDPNGSEIAEDIKEGIADPYSVTKISFCFQINAPELWDIDNPIQYTVHTTIFQNGKEIDAQNDNFGFRTIRFDPNTGFYLNGKHIVIKGVNCHQDYGLTGKAVPERVQKYKLKMIREMGANAFRTSHYPNSKYTMDCLDKMGFLVMDETRHFNTDEDSLKQLKMVIKRDRNRPGVILWSVGNEEPLIDTEQGLNIVKRMKSEVLKYDATRPITTAVCNNPKTAVGIKALEVLSVNYNLEDYDTIHKNFPMTSVLAGEYGATGTTRGWYYADEELQRYVSAYDHDTNSGFREREYCWRFLCDRKWVCGGFQWDAIEHRGESTFPRLSSVAGAIDLYLQKKDAFYQNQSLWIENSPILHLLPHWNWEGLEGEPIRVVAYTNCKEVELFLNGVSMGKKIVPKFSHAEWIVPYHPGTLRAEAGNGEGILISDEKITSKEQFALQLVLEDTDPIYADGKDCIILRCNVVDENGRLVPNASPTVQFSTNGMGVIVGTGSDTSDLIPPCRSIRRMMAGVIAVLVRAGEKKGVLKVYANANGLRTAVLSVNLN